MSLERELIDTLRQGAVLIDRRGYDGTRAVMPAVTHVMADALELGPRARPLDRVEAPAMTASQQEPGTQDDGQNGALGQGYARAFRASQQEPPRQSYPVTYPYLDAPDGARVRFENGYVYERHADTWELASQQEPEKCPYDCMDGSLGPDGDCPWPGHDASQQEPGDPDVWAEYVEVTSYCCLPQPDGSCDDGEDCGMCALVRSLASRLHQAEERVTRAEDFARREVAAHEVSKLRLHQAEEALRHVMGEHDCCDIVEQTLGVAALSTKDTKPQEAD